ncbi:MAG: 3'-5' exonuclease [Sedimenticola sp.]|nr:3'-5' exonuclease [Sedimenticola sp.]
MSEPAPSPITNPRARDSWPEYFDQLHTRSRDFRLQRFYAAGTVAADTPIINTPLVAMDFETTGLDAQRNEIVSIGIVPFSVHRIFCRESAHWVVNPGHGLTEGSVVIHGITHSDIYQAPDLESILEALLAAITGRIVVVHYRYIEREFLASALFRRLGESIEFPVIDTMALEQHILRRQQSVLKRLLKRPVGPLRLGDCRERYGLPHYQAHHALTDALATAELLQAQVAHHFGDDVLLGELWC